MDTFINSLPQNMTNEDYPLYIIADYNEGNVCTKAQVATAKAKGWLILDSYGNEYKGINALTAIILSVGTDGLTTYCPEYSIDLSSTENIAAYKASVSDNTVALTRVWTVAAGEGILLRSLAGGAVEEEVTVDDNITANTDNAFVGTLTDIILPATEDNATNFVLSKVDGVVGFFRANNTPIAAGKAYLPIESYDAARGITFVFDDTTGIIEVTPEQSAEDGAVYTLGGVRTTAPAKGLYIKNGKKVVVK